MKVARFMAVEVEFLGAGAGPAVLQRSDAPLVVDLTFEENAPQVVAELEDRRPGPYERWVKPAIDRVGALILIALFAPVMIGVAIAIWCQLGRPIFLRQSRVGRHGAEFSMIKFRTMTPDRRDDGPGVGYGGSDRRQSHKSEDDPRLVPVGRRLRKWSLDELPQLFNVLRGEMSLVGPRPELASIVGHYADWQHRRHLVKPGVTGLWQITERGNGLMHERTDVDLTYISRLSLLVDLRILLCTIPGALGRCRGV